jgi:cellulose synthase/poly-beta-1,6-N-acetylglucosamine synthase-like glycosyltransferase
MLPTVLLFAVLYAALGLLLYTWLGYPILLKLLPTRPLKLAAESGLPRVTVLVTVFNGAGSIRRRLENLVAQDYPADRLRIVVANDGSTDRTSSEARAVGDPRISVRDFPRAGKSLTQNAVLAGIDDEIVLFTDVDARFAPGFVRELVDGFRDPRVGATTGRLFVTPDLTVVSDNQRLYWRFEMWLRREESRTGILVTASGQCMAVRRHLIRPMVGTCGEDALIPLDVALQGFLVVHVETAVAFDTMPASVKGELHARARMIARSLCGIRTKKRLLSPLGHPGCALSLWSRKLFRWMTPVFLAVVVVCSLLLYPRTRWMVYSEAVYAVLCAVGALLERRGRWMPRLVSAAFSFLLANIGFSLGIFRWLRGRTGVRYTNVPV